ncbi:ABC transporter ATP-binding protein [Fructilactobacillus hinvesii]|uniref:ABC transporter ATP-binding protein n=1 Tax=Fructilactobacillus hinvesii TaxID=2940300 RepID=A0ABY5BW75_9LACO|nr:ABC transporter ATP-binding protein [Fructilactobacillus hinvesii]USS88236.1 ABC transporter ATP-binding protein [Fructilactobacillus hinvesii]
MNDNLISLKGISKYYLAGKQKIQILKNISLKINKEDFAVIMGHSGSGKSTLINILGFLDQKYDGTYKFHGKNYQQKNDNVVSELRNQNIGFIFQNFKLIKNLTVKENIEIPTTYSIKNDDKDQEQELNILLTKLGINDKKNNYPDELSGGQQQRVAIARALINKPSMIIADEPTGALDSQNTKDVIELFKNLNNNDKVTIIMVTHDNTLATVGNRLFKVNDGVLYED